MYMLIGEVYLKTPLLNFAREILNKIANGLHIGSLNIGGTILIVSVVNGYIEIGVDIPVY